MKNSAWYQKLWLKKLDKLPVKDADLGWKGMSALLDEQMPVSGNPAGRPNYSPAAKLIKTIIGYVLPVVVVTAISLYYTLPAFHHSKTAKVNKSHISHTGAVEKANQPGNNIPSPPNNTIADSTVAASPINTVHNSSKLENTTTAKGSPKALPAPGGSIATTLSNYKRSVTVAEKHIAATNNRAAKNNRSKTNGGNGFYNRANTNYSVKNGNLRIKHVTKLPRQKAGYSSVTGHHSSPPGNLKSNRFAVVKNSGNKTDPTNKAAQKQDISKDSVSKTQSVPVTNGGKEVNPVVAGSSPANNSGQPGTTSGNNVAAAQKAAPGNTNKGSATNPAKAKTAKNNPVKNKKPNKIITPRYNYGLEAGLNTGAANSTSFYFGGFGTYAIKPRLLINVGIRINSNRTISGGFTHVSYHGQDSIPPFGIVDTRKLLVADIPVTVEYKLFNTLSIKAGALFILPIKQSGINTKLAPIAYPRDTLYHTQEINTALNNTTMNRVNLGFTGGISLHIKKFDINANYQVLKPYKISDALGSYSKTYQTFQLGVGWRFR
jgi:hypothetical protein